jgi:hypothetical protein
VKVRGFGKSSPGGRFAAALRQLLRRTDKDLLQCHRPGLRRCQFIFADTELLDYICLENERDVTHFSVK